jgi:hypothetical protein
MKDSENIRKIDDFDLLHLASDHLEYPTLVCGLVETMVVHPANLQPTDVPARHFEREPDCVISVNVTGMRNDLVIEDPRPVNRSLLCCVPVTLAFHANRDTTYKHIVKWSA